jgi:hypothetical protein
MISAAKPLLNATLVFLLAILASPPSTSNIAAKDAFLSGTTLSTVAIQSNYPGYPESDNPDINRAPEWVSTPPQKNTVTPLPIPPPGPDVAFTVSQARAPPQC